ncbi:MAG TPA: DUF881 domain-containing protein [Marmoricola sp.]|jgi:uncharacterized protein YlxW (UPF0749 family)|nr:DUF881 domain-containing protein [Marmoricola sp.]
MSDEQAEEAAEEQPVGKPGPEHYEYLFGGDPDGAGTYTEEDEYTARQRAVRALLHPGRGQVTAAVLLAVLGIAGVTQVRLAGSDDEYASMRPADLIQALNGLQAASRRNDQDITDLEKTRSALRDSNDKTATALAQARGELSALGVLAGTLPATGPGVRITVTVPQSQISLNYLLDGIEELRDAGAEAMEINDSARVVAQTSFEAADGGGVIVDGHQLSSPFVIDAIGDASSLATALKFPGGFVDDVALDDGTVTIKEHKTVKITVTRAATKPRYASSTQGE